MEPTIRLGLAALTLCIGLGACRQVEKPGSKTQSGEGTEAPQAPNPVYLPIIQSPPAPEADLSAWINEHALNCSGGGGCAFSGSSIRAAWV